MKLKLVGTIDAHLVDVEDDENIPFAIDWIPVGSAGVPISYSVEDQTGGSSAGLIHLNINALTGEIIGAEVVIGLKWKNKITASDLDSLPEIPGSVLIDRSGWNLDLNGFPKERIIDDAHLLSTGSSESYIYFSFSEVSPVRKIMSGPAGFAVDSNDELTGIVVDRNSGPWIRRLSLP